MDEGLSYLLTLQGVGAISAEEEDLAVVEDFDRLIGVFKFNCFSRILAQLVTYIQTKQKPVFLRCRL